MKPKHIMVEQNIGNEVLWNSQNDRWSRRAKHQMNLQQKMIVDLELEKGDFVMYENNKVEVAIPSGPNATVGIMLEGKLKMVSESKIEKIDEGVMGGIKALPPINRMMQLAGLPVEQSTVVEEVDSDSITEDASTSNMFNSLYQKNSTTEYKNNPTAARLATVGQVLVGLETQIKEIDNLDDNTLKSKLDMISGVGVMLINQAKSMLVAEE